MAIRYGVVTRRSVLAGIALASFGMGGSAQADSPEALRFALISPQSRQEMEANWTPVLTALGRHLGRPVEMDVSSDYAGAIWNLRSGRAQFAWLGNKSAIEAVDNAGVEVFARETYPSGLGGYYTYLIVPKDSALTSVEDVIAHASALTLGRGDANSTSGTVVPNYYLFSQRHLEPRKIFKRVVQRHCRGAHRRRHRGQPDLRPDGAPYSRDHRGDPDRLALAPDSCRSPGVAQGSPH
ncbi:MAG: phosphate/phosphite/phosphonate ABC transporter substrate-binding protein [Rhodospirillaceae bacterium]|nr:phosphate/phosphite/phosphonate ABC transporter substrate-binding protein [Rhodospirillaceae bacterium]